MLQYLLVLQYAVGDIVAVYFIKPKHVKGASTCMQKMQLLMRDVGISIVLTVKIVVQFAVATDVYTSKLIATPCTSASHESEARKTERHWAYEKCKC